MNIKYNKHRSKIKALLLGTVLIAIQLFLIIIVLPNLMIKHYF